MSPTYTIMVSYRCDCLGPLGKSSWDVAAMLEVMVPGGKSYIPYTTPPFEDISRYQFGVVRQGFAAYDGFGMAQYGPEAKKLFERSLDLLGTGIDPVHIDDIEKLWINDSSSKTQAPGQAPNMTSFSTQSSIKRSTITWHGSIIAV